MPAKSLAPLKPVAGHPGLLTARKGAARMMAVLLKDGGLALYSPIPEPDDAAILAARDYGGVAAIIAPSPFHHLGIASWRMAFPDATFHAPEAAIPRLEKRIGATPVSQMPCFSKGVDFVAPRGLKASEVWLRSKGTGGTAWAVCDAFAGPTGTDDAPAESAKPRGAFASMCIGDKGAYKTWAMNQIALDNPTLLLPAHGNAVESDALSKSLRSIVEAL